MKNIFLSLAIIATFVLSLSVIRYYFITDTLEGLYNCKDLKIGMTKEQVQSAVGKPREILFREDSEGNKYELWNLDFAPGASETPRAEFDSNSGLLIEFICCEDLHVGVDKNNLIKYGPEQLAIIIENFRKVKVGQRDIHVKKLLGEPLKIDSYGGINYWRYPGVLSYDGSPTIAIHNVTGKVVKVHTGTEYLLSESMNFNPTEILALIN